MLVWSWTSWATPLYTASTWMAVMLRLTWIGRSKRSALGLGFGNHLVGFSAHGTGALLDVAAPKAPERLSGVLRA